MNYIIFLASLSIVLLGGELLVKSAVSIARKLRISPLFIGMTIVSFATSLPELLVSLSAAIEGHSEISVGNVLGSNITNIVLILGLTALIFPIPVSKQTLIYDWPAMMIATLICYFFMYNNYYIDRIEGIIMIILIISYMSLLVYLIKRKKIKFNLKDIAKIKIRKTWIIISYFIIGIFFLIFGSNNLVESAVKLAKDFNVSERVIAISMIAFGTSIPELSTSLVAAFRKQTDISIGNIIGSNLFNLLVIFGITSTVKPIEINPACICVDMPWVIATSLLLLPLMLFKKKFTRPEGAILFCTYIAYIVLVIINK